MNITERQLRCYRAEFDWLVRQSRAPRLRTMRQFAEQEIILPNGPHEGRRYRVDYQPAAGLYFDEVDSGHWQIINATGPSQSGKTLSCSIIPVLYHLFEIGETVIFGLPDMSMASDKWREDFLPVIERTRYRDLLPARGTGSRGGSINSSGALPFRNGATLRFMSGGGGDKSRAGYTARVVVITETDGMDAISEASQEADKIAQLIARTRSFGSRRRIYLECTLTTKQGRTWREYENGTASRIVLPCPYCGEFVEPGREHLVGWQEAETVIDARENARYACPACGVLWSEPDRHKANHGARLLHRGQTIDAAGNITGEMPKTDTLGFRWSAPNNLFVSASDVAADEWKGKRAENEDNAERELCQFIWALPYEADIDLSILDANQVMERAVTYKRGEIPDWATILTVGCDIGKYNGHWVAVAWNHEARGHVIDYGVVEIHGGSMAEELAILQGLRQFRDDYLAQGWLSGSGRKAPDYVLIDSRWKGSNSQGMNVIRRFCAESGKTYFPTAGFGAGQRYGQGSYSHPKTTSKTVIRIGEGYYLSIDAPTRSLLINTNSDHWKSWVHKLLQTAPGEAGSLSLFHVMHPREHLSFSKHLTAEREVIEFIPGKGTVVRWEQVSKNNHWLDALTLASVGAHFAGAKVVAPNKSTIDLRAIRDRRKSAPSTDGPFLATER